MKRLAALLVPALARLQPEAKQDLTAGSKVPVSFGSVDGFSEYLAKVQSESRGRLAELTAKYDAKLQEQEKENKALVRSNSHLAREILTARKQSKEMQKQVSKERSLVLFRRKEIQALEQQMAQGEKFLRQLEEDPTDGTDDAADDADDVDAISFLEVSRVSKRPALLDAQLFPDVGKLDVAQGLDEDVPEEALEQVAAQPSAKATAEAAEEDNQIMNLLGEEAVQPPKKEDNQISNLMSEDLQKLQQAESEIKKSLRKMFQQNMESGKQRHQALLHQKAVLTKQLESTQSSLKALTDKSAKLRRALVELESSLKTGGAFFRDMQKVSVAPVKKVPALLKKVQSHFLQLPKLVAA